VPTTPPKKAKKTSTRKPTAAKGKATARPGGKKLYTLEVFLISGPMSEEFNGTTISPRSTAGTSTYESTRPRSCLGHNM